ncbi:MAG: GGDEF domain-containing phosphodiesterase [Quadrisphaera sp.]
MSALTDLAHHDWWRTLRHRGPVAAVRATTEAPRRARGWSSWSQTTGPTAVLATRSAWRLLGLLYAAAGTLVIATTLVPAATPDRVDWVVRAMDSAAISSSVVLVLLSRRLPRAGLGPVVAVSTLLIAVCVLCSGGHSTAVAYACVFFVGPVFCRFVVPARQADAQLVLVLLLGVPVLAVQPGVTVGEQAIVWGITLVQSAAVRWLVDALVRAETDSLTGLANRRGVERALEGAVTRAADGTVGVILLELVVPTSEVGRRGPVVAQGPVADVMTQWRAALPQGAVLGRLTGLTFAVVLPHATLDRTALLAEDLRSRAPGPLQCWAGAVAWEAGESALVLMDRADSALGTARHCGSGTTYEHPGTGREGLELRRALAGHELVVHFQPIVDLGSQAVVGAEALVRWQHPERGLLLPGAFLSEVERCGLIVPMGAWMLAEACREAAGWPLNAAGEELYLSVNASGPELLDPTYATTVERALMDSRLAPERLVVELVESDYDSSSQVLMENLERLRTLGVRTAIDDFGVGHSSLDRLRRTGGALLKVDRSFVADITAADGEAPLVLAVLALGDALGMRVVAEGVETTGQAQWLHAHGCALAQGWLFGAACPPQEFRASAEAVMVPR